MNRITKRTNLRVKPLNAKESHLDQQIKLWRIKKDSLIKAIAYVKDAEMILDLINKWRSIAQLASNYLYNDFKLKMEKFGGFDKWQSQQYENKQQKIKEEKVYKFEEYMQSDEFKLLSDIEKKQIEIEYETLFESESSTVPEFTNEFTMKELYKILNKDYQLVYDQ